MKYIVLFVLLLAVTSAFKAHKKAHKEIQNGAQETERHEHKTCTYEWTCDEFEEIINQQCDQTDTNEYVLCAIAIIDEQLEGCVDASEAEEGPSGSEETSEEEEEESDNPDNLFEDVDGDVTTFIVDVSGSMRETFTIKGKKVDQEISRLQFVQQALRASINKLTEDQSFNMIMLYESFEVWQDDVVEATDENKASALQWIDSLYAAGKTNISDPIERAFDTDSDLTSIQLLTDGSPNEGITDVDEMRDFIDGLVQEKEVVINCISFMRGGIEDDEERQRAQEFLQVIAEESGGSFTVHQ